MNKFKAAFDKLRFTDDQLAQLKDSIRARIESRCAASSLRGGNCSLQSFRSRCGARCGVPRNDLGLKLYQV
jgi:hypothetical protein